MTSTTQAVTIPAIPPRQMLLGSLCAMVTVCIWSGWNIISRMGTLDTLSPNDITFLRFTVAGLISLPILFYYRARLRAAPLLLLLGMTTGAGAPYVWTASSGFLHAPAAHGVLIPGAMTLWVAIGSWLFFKEALPAARIAGYLLIAITIIWRLWTHSGGDIAMLFSDGWFLIASLLWTLYTLCNKKAGLPPLAAVAVVSTGSLVAYVLPYAATHTEHIAQLPLMPSLTQMAYQGIVVSFFALVSFNQAILFIGASRASAFAALIPATTTLLAMPILGEMPQLQDIGFVAMLSLGVLFATGLLSKRPGKV